MHLREFDFIVYGTSGFTGRQAVRYLQQYAPPKIGWAVAGRNPEKLELLEAGVPILVCDSINQQQADSLASRTHVLLYCWPFPVVQRSARADLRQPSDPLCRHP